MMLSLLFFCALVPLTIALKPVHVHHRVFHPNDPQIPFSERGTIYFSSDSTSVTLTASDNLRNDLTTFAENTKTLDGALYQVALEREGDAGDGHWDISSVKLASLPPYLAPNTYSPVLAVSYANNNLRVSHYTYDECRKATRS
jgi:hypothetical protein